MKNIDAGSPGAPGGSMRLAPGTQAREGRAARGVPGIIVQDQAVPGAGLVEELHALPHVGDPLVEVRPRPGPGARGLAGLVVERTDLLHRTVPEPDAPLDLV